MVQREGATVASFANGSEVPGKSPGQNGVALRNRLSDINGLAQNPIGYRYTKIGIGSQIQRVRRETWQADGTAGLPSAPEIPVPSGTYVSCQFAEVYVVDRPPLEQEGSTAPVGQ